MSKRKLVETVADIAYIAGSQNYFTGDSRQDISEFIFLAEQFEKLHKNTDWTTEDYILELNHFISIRLTA